MDSDDESQSYGSGGANGCVLLIDVSPPMWRQIADKKPIEIVMTACMNLIRKMILNSPKQLIGVSLFGTKKDDDRGIKNVTQILQLKELALDDILNLKEIVSCPDEIENKWGITDDFNLADALWQASSMFSSCQKKMSGQTITILSYLQEPNSNNFKAILKKATDILELGINVSIVNTSDRRITEESFYNELGKVLYNLDWDPPQPVLDVNDILTLIWANNHRKSATALLKMYLGPDLCLGVGLYSLCKTRTPPKRQYLHRGSNEIVVTSSMLKAVKDEENEEPNVEEVTGIERAPILRKDVTYYQMYGDRRVEITSEEMNHLKKFAGPPCIKLLGFKPASILNMSEWFYKPSAFIYPNEQLVEGSTTLFLALRDRCLVLERVAICVLTSRWFTNTRFVALVPQKCEMKGDRQIQPDGFHVIYLPFADHFKEFPYEPHAEITNEQKENVEKILQKLKFRYSNDLFENPKLQTLYKAIGALALNESYQEDTDDTTLPDTEEQCNRLGSFQEYFDELFGPMTVSPIKRTKNSDQPNKKLATEEGLDKDMLATRLKDKNIQKYTVAQLKQILKNANISVSSTLKKDQYVQLVYDNIKAVNKLTT